MPDIKNELCNPITEEKLVKDIRNEIKTLEIKNKLFLRRDQKWSLSFYVRNLAGLFQ